MNACYWNLPAWDALDLLLAIAACSEALGYNALAELLRKDAKEIELNRLQRARRQAEGGK